MKAHAASEEVDLTTMGAMAIEQRRIRKELADRQANLKRLGEEAAIARQHFADAMNVYRCQTTMTLPFGQTKVGERTYHLQAAPPLADAIATEAGPIVIRWE